MKLTSESYFPCPACKIGEVEKIGQNWVCEICSFKEDETVRDMSADDYEAAIMEFYTRERE